MPPRFCPAMVLSPLLLFSSFAQLPSVQLLSEPQISVYWCPFVVEFLRRGSQLSRLPKTRAAPAPKAPKAHPAVADRVSTVSAHLCFLAKFVQVEFAFGEGLSIRLPNT